MHNKSVTATSFEGPGNHHPYPGKHRELAASGIKRTLQSDSLTLQETTTRHVTNAGKAQAVGGFSTSYPSTGRPGSVGPQAFEFCSKRAERASQG